MSEFRSKISFPLSILRTNRQKFTKFYIFIYIYKIYVGIVTCHFKHLYNRYGPNILFLLNSENKLTEIYQLIFTRSKLGLLPDIFRIFVPELWPLINVRICFRSISWEQIDRISPNFRYAFILTITRLGLLPLIFCLFVTKLWPFTDVRNFVPAQCH